MKKLIGMIIIVVLFSACGPTKSVSSFSKYHTKPAGTKHKYCWADGFGRR